MNRWGADPSADVDGRVRKRRAVEWGDEARTVSSSLGNFKPSVQLSGGVIDLGTRRQAADQLFNQIIASLDFSVESQGRIDVGRAVKLDAGPTDKDTTHLVETDLLARPQRPRLSEPVLGQMEFRQKSGDRRDPAHQRCGQARIRAPVHFGQSTGDCHPANGPDRKEDEASRSVRQPPVGHPVAIHLYITWTGTIGQLSVPIS